MKIITCNDIGKRITLRYKNSNNKIEGSITDVNEKFIVVSRRDKMMMCIPHGFLIRKYDYKIH